MSASTINVAVSLERAEETDSGGVRVRIVFTDNAGQPIQMRPVLRAKIQSQFRTHDHIGAAIRRFGIESPMVFFPLGVEGECVVRGAPVSMTVQELSEVLRSALATEEFESIVFARLPDPSRLDISLHTWAEFLGIPVVAQEEVEEAAVPAYELLFRAVSVISQSRDIPSDTDEADDASEQQQITVPDLATYFQQHVAHDSVRLEQFNRTVKTLCAEPKAGSWLPSREAIIQAIIRNNPLAATHVATPTPLAASEKLKSLDKADPILLEEIISNQPFLVVLTLSEAEPHTYNFQFYLPDRDAGFGHLFTPVAGDPTKYEGDSVNDPTNRQPIVAIQRFENLAAFEAFLKNPENFRPRAAVSPQT